MKRAHSLRGQLAKLSFLQRLGAGAWDLSALPPNRRRFLAQWARRSTNQALQRWPAERRYPALLAFCADTAADLTDEVVELFDRALSSTDASARRELDELRKRVARATNEKVRLFIQLGRILLDPELRPLRDPSWWPELAADRGKLCSGHRSR